MDTYVHNLVSGWGLAHCTEAFKASRINALNFHLLSATSVEKILPDIGDQLTFMSNFNRLAQPIQPQPQTPLNEPVAGLSSTFCTLGTSTPCATESISHPVQAPVENESPIQPAVEVSESTVSYLREVIGLSSFTNSLLSLKRTLRDKERRKLSELIIGHMLRENPQEKISTERFIELANGLVKLFPLNTATLFYRAYCKERSFVVTSSGSLLRAYYGCKRDVCEMSDEILEEEDADEMIVIDIDCANELVWLYNHFEPWPEVEEKWAATREYRLSLLNDTKSKVLLLDYLEKFKVLRQPNGFVLIEADFVAKYPDKDLFQTNIKSFVQKAYEALKSTKPCSRELRLVLQRLALPLAVGESLNQIEVLLNLSFLVPPQTVLKKKEKIPGWRPSRSEIQDGFITLIENVSLLRETIERRDAKLELVRQTRQPFVILVGRDAANITNSYVTINDILYELPSPFAAIDVCFKTFFALYANYGIESRPLWLLLQTSVYDIFTPEDKKIATTSSISLLNKFSIQLKDF